MLFVLSLALALDLEIIVPQALEAAEAHKHEVLKAVKQCSLPKQTDHPTPLRSFDTDKSGLHGDGKQEPLQGEIIVFVSGSMPKAALKAFKNTNTRLVIKGLINGSLQETAALVKEIGVSLDIDPILFERLNIAQVPVFAVQKGDEWHVLKGNVTVSYAKEHLP